MTVEQRKQHVLDRYGVEPKYLWAGAPETFVFRHRSNRKWFAAILNMERGRLGLDGGGGRAHKQKKAG